MLRSFNNTCLVWLAASLPLCLSHTACSDALLDAGAGDLFPDGQGGASSGQGGPGQNGSGIGGAYPVVPLPGGASGGEGVGGASQLPIGDAGAVTPAPGDGGVAPPLGEEPGALFAVTSLGRLVSFDAASGALSSDVALSGLAAGEALLGADFRPADRLLYALAASGALYRIDTDSGAATLVSTLSADPLDTTAPFAALEGTDFAVDFNPVVDRLRVVSDTGQNLRINVDNGRTNTDGLLNPGAPSVISVAYTNAFGAACRTRLYGIDAAAGQLVVLDPPNDGKATAVGALGASGAPRAFDVYTAEDGANRAFVLLEQDGITRIHDVELATGMLSNARELALGDGERIAGAARAPARVAPLQAPGEIVGMTESDRLVSFNRGAPGKLCTASPVTGLAEGERVLGIDVRPADGALYALGSAGNVYTLDAATGAAALRAALSADPADTTAPYAGLPDGDYGIGFNPVPDRLRVTSADGLNLRINADTGATTTDAPLAAGASLTAVAYANAFAGAKATTLFALDTAAGSLVRIGGDPATGGACPGDMNNPNCGAVTAVGSLGQPALDSVAGFDIDGRSGAAGTAIAALSTEGSTTSSLFVVDLATGAASAPAGVAQPAIGGGERLSSLTLAANPSVSVYAVLSDWSFVSFSPRTPGSFDTSATLTGIDASEVLLGMDCRPADGRLYVLSSASRVYTVDPATAVATLAFTLAPAAADDNPFWGLDDRASHGVDFNPAADLLRVVSDWGQNLRSVPSARSLGTPPLAQLAGATFTDLDLGPDFPAVVASAYTNSYAGSARTTLFGIDADSDQLVRQGGIDGNPSPNTGVLTPVGPLGVDASDVSFDIAGGRDGLALAAIETPDSPVSLYWVSLATGVATPFNAGGGNLIGDGNASVTGMAIQLR